MICWLAPQITFHHLVRFAIDPLIPKSGHHRVYLMNRPSGRTNRVLVRQAKQSAQSHWISQSRWYADGVNVASSAMSKKKCGVQIVAVEVPRGRAYADQRLAGEVHVKN